MKQKEDKIDITPPEKGTPTLFDSLAAVQEGLNTIKKDKKAFKGAYATIEHVWDSIRHALAKNKFVITHSSDKDGVTTTAMHASGEKLESFMPWKETNDPQEQGKEFTYYKRYNLNAIFNIIIADEDTDATKTAGNYEKKPANGELAAKKITSAKTREDALEAYNKLSKDERITPEVIAAVEEMRKKYKEE